ncbi:MAG: glycosyltransferase [Lachnospiraceae bacterium]|nr:glycosyltransferase [Lachnospiraceae bacterium]
MKHIVIVITTGVAEYGGLTTVMMNYLNHMNLAGLTISFVSCNEIDDSMRARFEKLGIEYYCLPSRKKKPFLYYRELVRVLKDTHCDLIHVNGNSATMIIEMRAAERAGVRQRISHCHASQSNHAVINTIMHPVFNSSYSKAIAVSEEAGKWAYGNREFTVLKNAIETERFAFNKEVRKQYRKALGIQDRIVIGTIGKLNPPKNHAFLLRIMKELSADDSRYVFLLVGEGEERRNLEEYIKNNSLQDHVIMLGGRKDNAELLQAMDLFVFPSQYEGFGMALLEAEISGLPCICSENIPEITRICESVKAAPFDEKIWKKMLVDASVELGRTDRTERSKKALQCSEREGLNIKKEASSLRVIYESMLEGEG